MLRLALPNGTLQAMILEFFLAIGIRLPAPTRQHWVQISHDLVSQIVWARPQHIPEMVYRGVVDVGIAGLDCYYEWLYQRNQGASGEHKHCCRSTTSGLGEGLPDSMNELRSKVVGRVQIALIGSETEKELQHWQQLESNTEVFTEFPFWTRAYLLTQANAVPACGSVEAMVPKMYRYGITVVDTGKSLRQNHLRVVQELHLSKNKVLIRPKSPQTGDAWQYAVNLLAAKFFGWREFPTNMWSDWKE